MDIKEHLNRFLGLDKSQTDFPDKTLQKLQLMKMDRNMSAEKELEIWQNIDNKISHPDKRPLPAFGNFADSWLGPKAVWIPAMAILGIITIGFLFFRKNQADLKKFNIEVLAGNIKINGQKATPPAQISHDDIIEAMPGAKARIVFDEKNIFYLDSGTKISLKWTENTGHLELWKGRIGAILKNKKNFKKFRLSAPLLDVTIRGTSFFLDASHEGENYLCICHGRLRFNLKHEKIQRELISKHHQAMEFILEENKIKFSSGTLKFHDDKYMDGIAKMINQSIEWGK